MGEAFHSLEKYQNNIKAACTVFVEDSCVQCRRLRSHLCNCSQLCSDFIKACQRKTVGSPYAHVKGGVYTMRKSEEKFCTKYDHHFSYSVYTTFDIGFSLSKWKFLQGHTPKFFSYINRTNDFHFIVYCFRMQKIRYQPQRVIRNHKQQKCLSYEHFCTVRAILGAWKHQRNSDNHLSDFLIVCTGL